MEIRHTLKNIKVLDTKAQRGAGLGGLITGAITIVVAAIVVGFGARVLDNVNDGLTGTALAAVDNGTQGLANLSSYFGTLGTIIAAAVIIAVLVGAFAFGAQGRR